MGRILSEFRKSLRTEEALDFSVDALREGVGAIPVIILAAGASRRLGRSKALLRWREHSLLEQIIAQARGLTDRVTVVAGCGYPLLRYRTAISPARWVYNQCWEYGMSGSLAQGLRSLPSLAPGVLVLLVDQPMIPEQHLARLYRHALNAPGRAVATALEGKAVVPAYLPRSLWPALMKQEGDIGARRLLAEADPVMVACEEAAGDIDTPEDWRRFKERVRQESID